jgi:hypothetical protein
VGAPAAVGGAPERFGFDQLLSNGFEIIAEEPGREPVLGFVGRWWQRDFGRWIGVRSNSAGLTGPVMALVRGASPRCRTVTGPRCS